MNTSKLDENVIFDLQMKSAVTDVFMQFLQKVENYVLPKHTYTPLFLAINEVKGLGGGCLLAHLAKRIVSNCFVNTTQ